jgi:hypothetical protein
MRIFAMSVHIKFVVFLSLGLLLVFAWHFATVFGIVGSAPQTQGEFFIRFGIIVVVFVFFSITTSLIIARYDEQAILPDEREEKVELKAERNGGIVVYLGLILLMWLVFKPLSPMQMANSILAVMCTAELIKIGSGIYYLRRGH